MGIVVYNTISGDYYGVLPTILKPKYCFMPKTVQLNRASLYSLMVLVFCLCSKFQPSAFSAPFQGKPISISVKNTSLSQILRQISRKSGITIYFVDTDVAAYSNINFEAKDKEITVVLQELLDGRGLIYEIISATIIGVRKSPPPSEKKQTFKDTLITVAGSVTDEKHNPIVGATVLVKGSNKGATTGSDGSFSIRDISPKSFLTISSVQFLTRDIALTGRSILGNIELKEYIGVLDETIVIAYGTTTQRFNTGNVSRVKAKDIEKQPVNNPLLALAGRVPGLNISQSTGLPGSGIQVQIQGQNSIQSGNDPFYVIDGVPFTSQLLPNLGGVLKSTGGLNNPQSYGNPLSFLNPSDIESIEVLKDADATAIYGSRAANGAILITTKKGKAGQTRVDINLQTGIGEVARKAKLLNTSQYLKMRKEAYSNDNITIPSVPTSNSYDLTFWDQNKNTDWQKELIGNSAHYNDAQLSISGGNNNVQFLAGGGYHKETTVFPSDLGDEKASLHFSINNTSNNQKFKFSLLGSYLLDDNKLSNIDLTERAMVLPPNAPNLKNSDGTINWARTNAGVSSLANIQPLARLTQLYKNKTSNLIGNANLSYQILPYLSLSSNLGYTNLQTDELTTVPSSIFPPEFASANNRSAQYGTNNINSWIVEPQLSYDNSIGDGKLNVLIGSTIQQSESNRKRVDGSGYANDLVLENINAAQTVSIPINTTIQNVYKYNALFGRINYNWKDRYIINLTARRDGTSRFGSENRFHNFSAVGVAWVFSNENFVSDNLPFLSFGKIRTSYGTTGSDQIPDYAYLSLYDNNNPPVPYSGGGGLTPTNISNPYLQWEEVKKMSIGVDAGFLKDRILVNATYYQNRSSNQLLSYALAPSTGFGGIQSNFPATIQNYGWELAINLTNIRNNHFKWSSNINLTIPKNKLISFENLSSSSYASNYRVGLPITVVNVYKFHGVNSTTGIYEFVDAEGKLTSNPINSVSNRTEFVNTAPTLFGGFQNNLSYKGISIDFLFQFVKQRGITNYFGNNPGNTASNQPITVLERWKTEGEKTDVQRFFRNNIDYNFAGVAVNGSDAVYKDASFIRLKNVSLSWQFPENWIKRVRLQNIRLYTQAQNLLTITHYSGLDPETRSLTSLPPLRVITFGLQISL